MARKFPKANVPRQHVISKGNHAHLLDLIKRGFFAHQKGELDKAGSIYDQILKIQPNYFDALQLKAALKIQLGLFAEAITLFDRALRINERNSALWFNRGMAFEGLNDKSQAIKCYEAAISISPDYLDAIKRKEELLAKN